MQRLHVGHYNAYMLDRILQHIADNESHLAEAGAVVWEAFVKSWFADALDRVDPICDQILDAPYDIFSFNEVWDEECRARFIKRLGSAYPYHTEVLGSSTVGTGAEAIATLAAVLFPGVGSVLAAFVVKQLADLLKTSGLLVFSRYPFEQISKGKTCEFVQFTDGAGDDALAAKGGGAVVIQPPDSRKIVFGFTHLQADYGDEPTHSDVRRKQIDQWWDMMKGVAKKTGSSHFIAVGDLNIIGNKATDEYFNVFKSSNKAFDGVLQDQWATTHSPSDEFITHPGDRQRLDYLLTGTWTPGVPRICAHHMMLAKNLWSGPPQVGTPFSEPGRPARGGGAKLSDHIGINAVINVFSPFCNPKEASEIPAFIGDKFKTKFVLPANGGYYWFHNTRLGTMFVNVPFGQDLEVMQFDGADLSSGFIPIEPPGWTAVDQRTLGSRFAVTTPGYFRVRQMHPSDKHLVEEFVITMATGESRKMAQYLNGGVSYTLNFPKDAVLNAEDKMFCEALPNVPSVANASQTIRLTLKWPVPPKGPPDAFELSLEDGTGKVLGSMLCKDPKGSVLSIKLAKPIRVFPRIKRLSKKYPVCFLRWDSDLTLLHGPSFADRPVPGTGPLSLECTDETDSDWLGSDEPVFRVTIDGAVTREQSYDDVDSGTVVSVEKVAPIAYQKGLQIHLEEGSEGSDGSLPPLAAGKPLQLGKTMNLDPGSGNYEFHYNVSQWLESSPLPKQKG